MILERKFVKLKLEVNGHVVRKEIISPRGRHSKLVG